MTPDYNPETIVQGRINQNRTKETPNSFAMESNTSQVAPSQPLDKTSNDKRMAGRMGERIKELMNNPEEMKRTQMWMQNFGLSNQGAQFNMAKMGGAPPQ